jgi:neopullulanase
MKRFTLALALLPLAFAAPPMVSKVEPPDWVPGPSATSLRVLLTGANLAGATVKAQFATSGLAASPSGTHLFFDLKIPAHATRGKYPFQIETPGGRTEAPFSLVAPLPPAGRFQGFSSDDIVYLIMPDRFANGDPLNDDPAVSRGMHDRKAARYYHGGDFEGIIQHLPYLRDLGVTAIWLTPIYNNANRLNEREKYDGQAIADYHGYGAVDFYGVEEHFGTLDKFRELVDRAHALGIKVIQDQVANHTGPYHPWVEDPPTATWFHGTQALHISNTWRIWTLIDPHASPAAQKSTLDGWFAGILPDLNQDDPEVARYLIQNTLWWISRTGFDGIRQDTLPYVPRRFWRDWTTAIRARYPHFNVVGEVFDSDPALVSFFQGGKMRFDGIDSGVDALFDFPLQNAMDKVFTGAAPLRELPKVLAHDALYPDANRLVTFIDLHDLPRFLHRRGATREALIEAFTFLLTTRGIPMLYYGGEIGMNGGDDPDNRRDFPGGWKEDPSNAFDSAQRTPEQQALFQRFQHLARLRAATPPLRRGSLLHLLVEDDAYVFARLTSTDNAPGSRVLVAFNNAAVPAILQVPLTGTGIADGTRLEDLLGAAPPIYAAEGIARIKLPPHSSAIYR